MKVIKPTLAIVSGAILSAFGGWDIMLKSLCVMMGVDYVLGVIVAIMHKSNKSENGGLSSLAGWAGLVKKVTILLLIMVSVEIDCLLGVTFVRSSTIIFFAVNELISIGENTALMGVKLPDVFHKAIELLKGKNSDE